MTELVQRMLVFRFVVLDEGVRHEDHQVDIIYISTIGHQSKEEVQTPLGYPGIQSALVLPLSESQSEETVHSLRDSIGTARFEINLTTLSANPGFDAGDSHFDSLSLELLRDRFPTQLALTL